MRKRQLSFTLPKYLIFVPYLIRTLMLSAFYILSLGFLILLLVPSLLQTPTTAHLSSPLRPRRPRHMFRRFLRRVEPLRDLLGRDPQEDDNTGDIVYDLIFLICEKRAIPSATASSTRGPASAPRAAGCSTSRTE